MTLGRHLVGLSGLLALAMIAGQARGDGPVLRVGMEVIARSPDLILVDGGRAPKTLAYPRIYVVERVEGDTVRLFRWAEKGLAAASAVIPLDQAISYFDGRIKAHPREAFGYLARAAARAEARDYDGALADANEAIRLDPSIARAYVLRGRLRNFKLDDDGATADLNEAVRRDPNDPQSRAARGQYRLGRMRLDEALADANEAIRLSPTCPDGYSVRAGVASWNQEYDKALADMNRAIQLDPWESFGYSSRGFIWAAKHENEKALADFNEAVRRDPTSEHALTARGQFFGQVDRLDEALADADAGDLASRRPMPTATSSGPAYRTSDTSSIKQSPMRPWASCWIPATPTRSCCGGTRTIARMTWTRRSGTTPRRSGWVSARGSPNS